MMHEIPVPTNQTVLLDSFVIELRVAASLGHEIQRDILRQLDDSSFGRRVLPDICRTLHDAKMNMIQPVLKR